MGKAVGKRTKDEIVYNKSCFEGFNVFTLLDNHSFVYIDINDEEKFYNGIIDYVLNENNILRYATNKVGIEFKPTLVHYSTLYKELYLFVGKEDLNDLMEIEREADLEKVIEEEHDVIEKKDDKYILRKSKIGRIGEYILHIFLSSYFDFSCVIPKYRLATDSNMSVYGIDTIHYCKGESMLLFGESKVCKNIDNGIKLINKSLEDYEDELRDEFILVLSSNLLRLVEYQEVFGEATETSICIEEFMQKASINKIGVPVFIVHGKEKDEKEILQKLKEGIKRKQLFNKETVYYAISLPVVSKGDFLKKIASKMKERMENYEHERKKSNSSTA